MNANEVASAYLTSLVQTPGSHLITLDSEPLPQIAHADLALWMEGLRCGNPDLKTEKFPTADEVFVWVDLALQRYFHEDVPEEPEPLKAKAQAAAAPIPQDDKRKSVRSEKAEPPRRLGVPNLRIGFAAR